MSWTRFFRRRYWDQERARELESYLEAETDENIARGMSPEEARYAAHRKLGNSTLIREEIYHMNSLGWIDTLWQDIRFGLRMLAKNPGFTAVAVITLALGIGANTAMFSVVNAVLLRPLPFNDAGRLVEVEGAYANDFVDTPKPHFEWAEWAEKLKTLSGFSFYENGTINLAGDGEPDRVAAAEVSDHFFGLLGINPIRGRTFLPAEQASEHPFAAIISYELWRSRYGSDPGVVGKTIHLNGKPFTIIGVMPSGFEFPGQTQIWVTRPRNLEDEMFGGMAIGGWEIARLRSGATPDLARAELEVIAYRDMPAGLRAANPVSVISLHQFIVGDLRPALLLLLGAVGFVLLIACTNVAHLSLARGVGRFREIALRAALGAGRARLVRQLLTESVLLALAGGALGLLTSVWTLQVAKKLVPAQDILTRGIKLDGWVLTFTFVVAVLTGIISGLAPARQSSKLDLSEALKESVGSHTGLIAGSRHRVRGLLGVFEIAAALVLLIGAGLLLRSFWKLLAVDRGFRANGLVAARISLLEPRYRANEERLAFFQEVLSRVKTLPGVRDAAITNVLPFGRGGGVMFGLNFGRGPQKWGSGDGAFYLVVSDGYFQTMGIPFLGGRNFTEGDGKGPSSVAIVSQSLARHGWPGQNPLGKHFNIVGDTKHPFEVVGVVGDVRGFDLEGQPSPQMYVPILQHPPDAAFLVIHGTQNSSAISASLRGVIRSVDKNEPIASVGTMDQLISQSVAAPRFRTSLLGIFAGLAFLLAVVGIYGIISYSVSQRAHEIGIRMALGAERREVMTLVLRQGMRLALTGVGIGMVAALGLSRLLTNYLYSVRPADPLTFVLVSVVVIAVALLASYLPARRAMMIDPLVALRYQ